MLMLFERKKNFPDQIHVAFHATATRRAPALWQSGTTLLTRRPGSNGCWTNSAATRFSVDVWVATDWISEGDGRASGGIKNWQDQVIGSPVLLTSGDSREMLTHHGLQWRGETIITEDLWSYCPGSLGWTLYSAFSNRMLSHRRIDAVPAKMRKNSVKLELFRFVIFGLTSADTYYIM